MEKMAKMRKKIKFSQSKIYWAIIGAFSINFRSGQDHMNHPDFEQQ
jgi:hypothetical protein